LEIERHTLKDKLTIRRASRNVCYTSSRNSCSFSIHHSHNVSPRSAFQSERRQHSLVGGRLSKPPIGIGPCKAQHNIFQMYAIRDTFSPILQSYFQKTLEERQKGTPRQRAQWLQLEQIATSQSSAAGSQQTMLSHFFQHASSNTVGPHTGTVLPSTVPEIPAILQQMPITSFLTHRASPLP
jgi:hypothetical protein